MEVRFACDMVYDIKLIVFVIFCLELLIKLIMMCLGFKNFFVICFI